VAILPTMTAAPITSACASRLFGQNPSSDRNARAILDASNTAEWYGSLQIKCRRCETYASIPLEHIRRSRWAPGHAIWKLRPNADRAGRRGTRRRTPD
jgi:hypothetical protein